MTVKFTKLAALLLAGAALFASGCTDYEVDIQRVDKKVDDLTSGKVASLENQVAALQATVATLETQAKHDEDIQKLNKTISDLETALKADYQKKIQDAVNALDAAKLDKATFNTEKEKIMGAIDEAKARIKAIEDADFQKQIDDLNAAITSRLNAIDNKITALENGKADKEQVAKDIQAAKDEAMKAIAAVETALNGKIAKLDERLTAAEAAIKKINEELIPGLQDQIDEINNVALPAIREDITDLQNGKLDKAEFDEYYKKAYDKYTKATIDAMQEAINALTALTAGFPEGKTIKEYVDGQYAEIMAKFDDYVLKTTFEEFVKIAATKAELAAVKAELEGRIKVCEDLLAGDWGGKTVKQYIDDQVASLQAQIDDIVKVKIPELDKRVSALETSMETVLDTLAFAMADDGTYDLQGYIDDAAYDAYLAACEYTDEYMDFLIDQINEILAYIFEALDDIFMKLDYALQRIQSIQFVPEYDDLKITTNMAWFYQPGSDLALPVDQPTKVTYQFLPAQYAKFIGEEIQENVIRWQNAGLGAYTREELKGIGGYDGLIAYFDVRPVDTRTGAEIDGIDPEFIITSVDEIDEETGEITFTVQPVGIASAQFQANGLKPVENTYMTDGVYDDYFGLVYYPLYNDENDDLWYTSLWEDMVHYVYDLNELKAYEARTAFAAQLRLYRIQDFDFAEGYYPDYRDDYDVYPPIDYDGDGFADYENELASPYNVLYPAVSEIEVLEEPYKKEDDGTVRPFNEDEIWQTLPYSALRKDGEDAIGEVPEQDPKGYRIILDQAVPVVSINGGEPMTLEAAAKAGYVVPAITTSFTEFTYADAAGAELSEARKKNFVETAKVYAEIEMNPEKPASTRKQSVGDVITGAYEFTSVLGSFSAEGYVTITKPQGSVNVSADINWVYAQDADTDHEVYYNGADAKYSHDDEPITIDAESAKYLEDSVGIVLADFAGKTPKSLTIEPDGLRIADLSITDDGGIEADFIDFEWGKTYTVKAVYELDAAEVTVNGTVTTTDRKRDLIEITLDEYVFDLNGDDYDATNDTYTSEPQEFQQPLFDKFVENKIINQGTPADFADADAFVGVDNHGKEGGLRVVTDEDNSTFLVIADDNATIIATSAELKEIMGTEQVIYVTTYTGQKVKIIVPVNVNLPAYDFLHLRYYTFNKDEEVADFITKRDFADNDGNVKWWTQVNPSYFTTVDPNAVPGDASNRISYRHALADYDVAYINLAELAFNVVDEKDDVMDEAAIAAANLVVKFDYSVSSQGTKALPTVDQLTNFKKYSDLWVDNTVFYYRTNAKKFIPAKGTLAILSGDTEFPLPTRFDTPKNSVKKPEIALDYSSYAVVRWTPFKAPVATGYTIVLDENKIYEKPLFEGMELQDNRPSGVSYYVIKNGEWVKGNVTAFNPESSTAPANGNGYIQNVMANDAYHITTTFDYDVTGIPVDLRKLLKVETKDGVPYITYDYRSQVEFHGVITIPVTVALENPWQETINFEYTVTIKGVGD